ncbi:hypothetical protein PCE1_002205 [Barthelona sp. PCE]
MPRLLRHIGKSCNFEIHQEHLIVFNNDDSLNTKMCCITHSDKKISAPSGEPLIQSVEDSTLFFYYHKPFVHLFSFDEGAFVETGCFDVGENIANFEYVINRNLCLFTTVDGQDYFFKFSNADRIAVTFDGVEGRLYDDFQGLFVQNDTLFIQKEDVIKDKLTYDDEGNPFFSTDHPLMNVKGSFVDLTPGDNKIIVHDDGVFDQDFPSSDDDKCSSFIRLQGHMFFILRNEGTLKLYDQETQTFHYDVSGYKPTEFICIGNEMYHFSEGIYHNICDCIMYRCSFVVHKSCVLQQFDDSLNLGAHINYQLVLNVHSDYSKMYFFPPKIDCLKMTSFYNPDISEWCMAIHLMNNDDYTYTELIDTEEIRANSNDEEIVFNANHVCLAPDTILNGVEEVYCKYEICGNCMWSLSHNVDQVSTLAICFLDCDSNVERKDEMMFSGSFDRMMVNQFAVNEAVILGWTSPYHYFVRYVDGKFEFKKFPIWDMLPRTYCFIGVGAMVMDSLVYIYGEPDVEGCITVQLPDNTFHSFCSKAGELIRVKPYLQDFCITQEKIVFDNSFTSFEIEIEIVDIKQVLENAQIFSISI